MSFSSAFIRKGFLTLLTAALFVVLVLPSVSAKAEDEEVGTMTITEDRVITSETKDWLKELDHSSNGDDGLVDDNDYEESDCDLIELNMGLNNTIQDLNEEIREQVYSGRYVTTSFTTLTGVAATYYASPVSGSSNHLLKQTKYRWTRLSDAEADSTTYYSRDSELNALEKAGKTPNMTFRSYNEWPITEGTLPLPTAKNRADTATLENLYNEYQKAKKSASDCEDARTSGLPVEGPK